ncbi:hypothetical protein DBR06_SOUSAS2910008, partial [Sousa chinensis]
KKDKKCDLKNADMLEDIQQDPVELATQALEKYNTERSL